MNQFFNATPAEVDPIIARALSDEAARQFAIDRAKELSLCPFL